MRTEMPVVVIGPSGPVEGALVTTYIRGTSTLATGYTTESGSTPAPNPATTDEHGGITQWFDRGAYRSVIAAGGLDPYDEDWDSAPGSDQGIDPGWLAPGAAGGRVVSAGNLGAAYALDVVARPSTQLVGTLNANCTVTLTNVPAGADVVLLVKQDGTGGRSLAITFNGQTAAVPVQQDAGVASVVTCYSPNGTDLYVKGGLS